jgi:xanthine dehydrogenase iron-sulfur cluster and FAD-binding subunit A
LHPVQEDFSGDLCRCTGYRPILDAAQHMASLSQAFVEATDLLLKVELLSTVRHAPEPTFVTRCHKRWQMHLPRRVFNGSWVPSS